MTEIHQEHRHPRMQYAIKLIGALFASALLLAAGPAGAQAYPSKPIRWVVPFPASGATDILTRTIAQKLSEALGKPVIVDNKPGAGGALGSDIVAKAAPDGYTLLMATTSTHSIGPALQKLPYDAQRDFAAISSVADATNVLIVSPQLGVNSVRELIALAKSKPGQLNYSSSGTGSIVHLSGERFKSMTGVEIQHIPYKGTALAIPDIINGQIAMMFDSIVSVMPHIRSGKVKALAISSQKRSVLLPELPTMIEAGVPGYVSDTYFGVFAPAGTPADIVARLNAELVKIVHDKETRERLLKLGAEPVGSTPQQLADLVKSENAKWAKVIKDAGIKVE
jgi:tripartite-type tricarboxylate transporter receptor subunit TctC